MALVRYTHQERSNYIIALVASGEKIKIDDVEVVICDVCDGAGMHHNMICGVCWGKGRIYPDPIPRKKAKA